MSTIMDLIDEKLANSKKTMTIAESLGAKNGQTIMHALEEIEEVEVSSNPLTALAMDFDISASTDLLGKYVDDLQEDMAVVGNHVTGTAKYVSGYTGFSSKTDEQKGNFVAFHISVGDLVIGTNVTVKVNGVTMDPDGLHVMRFVDDKVDAKAIVEASADGHPTVTKGFDFSAVTRIKLETVEPEEVEVPAENS